MGNDSKEVRQGHRTKAVSLDSELDLILNPQSLDEFITVIRVPQKTERTTAVTHCVKRKWVITINYNDFVH